MVKRRESIGGILWMYSRWIWFEICSSFNFSSRSWFLSNWMIMLLVIPRVIWISTLRFMLYYSWRGCRINLKICMKMIWDCLSICLYLWISRRCSRITGILIFVPFMRILIMKVRGLLSNLFSRMYEKQKTEKGYELY